MLTPRQPGGVSGISPTGIILLIALLPQFTARTGWPAPVQMSVLGGLHILDCATVYFIVALLARRILRSRPRAAINVTKVSGVLMTTIGLGIPIEQIAHLARWPRRLNSRSAIGTGCS